MTIGIATKKLLIVFCVLWGFGCSEPDVQLNKSEVETTNKTLEIVTAQWPDGEPRRKVEVLEGDTLSISLFDPSGQLTKYGEWKNSKRHGASRAFYPNGSPWAEHIYINGTQVGPYRTWYANGNPFIIGHYDSLGQPIGNWQFFDEQGELIKEQSGDSIPS